jgi:hypothetical protein
MADKNDAYVTKGLVARRVCRNGKRGRELSAGGEAGFRALFDDNTSEHSTIPYLCQYLTVRYSGSTTWHLGSLAAIGRRRPALDELYS